MGILGLENYMINSVVNGYKDVSIEEEIAKFKK